VIFVTFVSVCSHSVRLKLWPKLWPDLEQGVLSEKSYPDVMVVQPRQDWDGDNDTGPLDRPTQRRILAQGQVRSYLIVVRRVRRKNLSQVRLTKDQQPVEALASHGANQTLHIRVLPWRSR
jgi:hypothetical protein